MERELRMAIAAGNLDRVQRLVEGGASTAVAPYFGGTCSALMLACLMGRSAIVVWLVIDAGVSVSEVNDEGFTALLCAATEIASIPTLQWLFENGGANITDTTFDGRTVWDLLKPTFLVSAKSELTVKNAVTNVLTDLLRAMVMRSTPPADLVVHMSLRHSQVAEEGARLRAGLPAYLARRRALLAEHTSLIAPLRALISRYEEPTTTEELWAAGNFPPLLCAGQAP
jgi:hypothetical protein